MVILVDVHLKFQKLICDNLQQVSNIYLRLMLKRINITIIVKYNSGGFFQIKKQTKKFFKVDVLNFCSRFSYLFYVLKAI